MSAETKDEVMLVCVRNKLANSRVTELIPVRTYPLAIFGFVQFVETEVEKQKLDKRLFELVYCGTLKSDGQIYDTDNFRVLCNGSEASEVFESLQQELFDKEASL